MRQQLLRRLWHKEYRRFDRTGSLSPPLHRSLRTKRTLKLQDTRPDVCLECERLEANFNRSVPEIASHHSQHNGTTATSQTSSFTFAQKSYSIETETINDASMLAISSVSSTSKSQPSQPKFTPNESIRTSQSESNQMNGNSIHDDQVNGNMKMGSDSYLIEMDDDRINITTMAMTESTANMSSAASAFVQSHELSNSDGNNNNHSTASNSPNGKITEISHMRGGVYDAYHMSSGEIDLGNESVVRLKTHEPLNRSTIDSIISQILVDSLNNIIVVQGKGQQNELNGNQVVELSASQQTQTEHHITATADDSASNTTSSLPLPVTDQIYFPHYMSTETLSEYSTKLSDDSNAVDLLPSNLVISVISGSSYPGDGGEMIVHRMADMQRTESMEVQPSSATSMRGHDDVNGNPIAPPKNETVVTKQHEHVNTNEENDNDDNVSIDSLDDPHVVECTPAIDNVPISARSIEKSQAFFIAIANNDDKSEVQIVQSPVGARDVGEFGLNAPLSKIMPERLRERLEKRQLEINERKEIEEKRRQAKLQKLINQHANSKSSSTSFEVIQDESSANVKMEPEMESSSHSKVVHRKFNSKQLKSNIGSLESYTVDAQGNLKFVDPSTAKKSNNGNKKLTKTSGPIVKHVAIKKTIMTKKPLTTVKKSRDAAAIDKSQPIEKRAKAAINIAKHRIKEANSNSKVSKDVQKMTLSQHSPSDLITPDRDCGPRRLYQKTEICEGAKRIEILEIVECKLQIVLYFNLHAIFNCVSFDRFE